MREIIEIYTKSKTFNHISEIMKEVNRIRTKEIYTSFWEIARYVCEGKNNKNILVELQVSTKWCRDNDIKDSIEIVAYEFEGELENYSADNEIGTIKFNNNWKTAIDQMRNFALELKKELYGNVKNTSNNDVITIICSKEQEERIRECGCIAHLEDVCNYDLCNQCVYYPNNIEFKRK